MCALHALIEVCGLRSCVHARDANARAARDYRAARRAAARTAHCTLVWSLSQSRSAVISHSVEGVGQICEL